MNLPSKNIMSTELIKSFGQFKPLSREEEYSLALRLKKYADVNAAEKLITSNLKNVVRIAYDYSGYGLPLEDIIQEGTIGLMIAVKKFDPLKGYRLMTYATWWVKAMIHDYILKFYSQVKIGTTKLQKKLFYGLNKLSAEESINNMDIESRSNAISAKLDADPKQVNEIITRLTYRDQSLDSPMNPDSDTSFLDFLADTRSNPEDNMLEKEKADRVKKQVEKALSLLTPREQVIARERLMAETPATLEDLGNRYDISKERVRQIETGIKEKLQKALLVNIAMAAA